MESPVKIMGQIRKAYKKRKTYKKEIIAILSHSLGMFKFILIIAKETKLLDTINDYALEPYVS